MRRLSWIPFVLAATLLVAVPAEAGPVVARGTVAVHDPTGAGPEHARFLAEGCAQSVEDGVFEAVIDVSDHAGTELKLTVHGADVRVPTFDPIVRITAIVADDCDPGRLLSFQVVGAAAEGSPLVFDAPDSHVKLLIASAWHGNVSYTLRVD